MFPRLTRIVTTFAAVFGAYLAYSLAAVPFIEPSVKERESSSLDLGKLPRETGADTRAAQLERWFPPDAWERNNPTILETAKGALLIREYKRLDDGRLKLTPCTLVLQTSPDGNDEENGDISYVLLQAPEGALLDFDGPMKLAPGQVGRLEGGTLKGPVTIRTPDKRPDAEDYLVLRTGNVQITKDRILAPHEVEFRYGRNYGSGQDLIIVMEPDDDADDPQFGRLKTLELVHVNRIHVQVDTPDELRGLEETTPSTVLSPLGRGQGEGQKNCEVVSSRPLRRKDRSDPSGEARETIDLEVSCEGPFKYDFQQRVARFEDQVKAWSPIPDGPPDQLTCDLLRIFFLVRDEKVKQGRRAETTSQSSNPSPKPLPEGEGTEGTSDGKPQDLSALGIGRIVAEGSPAVLRAPSYEAFARGELLEFDLQNRRVRFRDCDKVILRYRQNQVEVPAFDYRFSKDGRLGQLWADGPGFIRGALPDEPSKTFEAVWQERLILQPDDGDHALSFVSGASIRYHGFGEFSADNLHVWLRESVRPSPGKGKPKVEYRPVSLLAERNVEIDSWHLSGNLQKAEVWIRYEEDDVAGPVTSTRDDQLRSILDPSQDAKRSARRFDIQSQGLQLQLLQSDRDTEVERLVINGNVRLREIRTEDPNDIPLAIDGEIVQVDYANTPQALAHIQGKRAKVCGRGLTITADDIQLDRGKNRLWIPGPGKMTLPARKARAFGPGSSRLPNAMASPMTVTWGGHMDSDGQVAKFHGNVQVQGLQQSKKGDVFDLLVTGHDLEVVLTHRVDFSKKKQAEELDVQRLAFRGSVSLHNYGSKDNKRTSYDRMEEVRDLTIDSLSGDLHASGPGWVSSVRYEHSLSRNGIGRLKTAANSDDAELVYIRVDFEDEIVGNIERRDMEFRGRVRCVLGPVATWDETLHPEPREGPLRGQLLLTSERLSVVEMGTGADNKETAVELVADRNVTIEGKKFAASGWRIKYTKAKELLILEGDGRNDAKLWLSGSVTPTAAGQRILFWTDTNEYKWEGGRELHLLP